MHQLSNLMRWFRLHAMWRMESRCSAWMNALLGTTIKAATRKNRKDQTTGEKRIGRQQKKQCDATRAAEGWRRGDRDAGLRDCGTQRTGSGSVKIADKSS